MLLWLAEQLGEFYTGFLVVQYITLRAILAVLTALPARERRRPPAPFHPRPPPTASWRPFRVIRSMADYALPSRVK